MRSSSISHLLWADIAGQVVAVLALVPVAAQRPARALHLQVVPHNLPPVQLDPVAAPAPAAERDGEPGCHAADAGGASRARERPPPHAQGLPAVSAGAHLPPPLPNLLPPPPP